MMGRILGLLVVVAIIAVAGIWLLGRGAFVTPHGAGTPIDQPIPRELVQARADAQRASATEAGVRDPQQILFGDLHVHSTFSFDAFIQSLPLAGGDGAHPISDACDYARYCSALDFWSINDHALASTPKRWRETIDGIRQCNAVAGDYASPDTVAYLGWEWTQVGDRPENHWGHKNVVLRDLEDDKIPTRPIAARPPGELGEIVRDPPTFQLGMFAAYAFDEGGREFARYMQDMLSVPICPEGVSVHELPDDCREAVATPHELFAKLDEWGVESTVIPHGTTWGFYTPLGSSWDKQLTKQQHDPNRQRMIEVMSGHGNSEEYRSWKEVEFASDGSKSCPPPTDNYTPSCHRAGEIIRERCLAAGVSEEVCDRRAQDAQQYFVDAEMNGGANVVPGYTVEDWLDAGQCTDCFQPAFNYRPKSSVQYIMALSRDVGEEDPLRFRFGFMASSDNHSARPGTGYKEVSRAEFTEARFGNFVHSPLGAKIHGDDPLPISQPFDADQIGQAIFGVFEAERQASFFLNGGLVAVHADSRDRNTVYEALQNRQIYGTSGPRILLWFDLLNAPGAKERTPMGSQTAMSAAPIFEVRAVGSFEQLPGCPEYTTSAMSPERVARVCQGECYNPSDVRRKIARIEVVRIRPQNSPSEDVAKLIDDPWRVFECDDDPSGCRVVFSDDEFRRSGRDALYYVRAIEEPSMAVQADPLRCERDEAGNCIAVDPCFKPDGDISDDCLAPTEERAWSSPIFVDHAS